MMQKSQQLGSALLYVILILAVLMVISFGISTVSLREVKTTSYTAPSMHAYYAAESEVERGLFKVFVQHDATGAAKNHANCFGDLSSSEPLGELDCKTVVTAASPSPDSSVPYDLKELEYASLFFFDPANLTVTTNTPPSGSQLTITSESSTASAEVATIYFNPADLGRFDFTNLTSEDSFGTASGISIDRQVCTNNQLHGGDGGCTVSLADTTNLRYLIQARPIHAPATLVFTTELGVPIAPAQQTIQAFATDRDKQIRRAVSATFDASKRPLHLFDFVLFSDAPIEKNAVVSGQQQ